MSKLRILICVLVATIPISDWAWYQQGKHGADRYYWEHPHVLVLGNGGKELNDEEIGFWRRFLCGGMGAETDEERGAK